MGNRWVQSKSGYLFALIPIIILIFSPFAFLIYFGKMQQEAEINFRKLQETHRAFSRSYEWTYASNSFKTMGWGLDRKPNSLLSFNCDKNHRVKFTLTLPQETISKLSSMGQFEPARGRDHIEPSLYFYGHEGSYSSRSEVIKLIYKLEPSYVNCEQSYCENTEKQWAAFLTADESKSFIELLRAIRKVGSMTGYYSMTAMIHDEIYDGNTLSSKNKSWSDFDLIGLASFLDQIHQECGISNPVKITSGNQPQFRGNSNAGK